MIMGWGDKMKSAYLERVKFREGVDLRLRILSISKVVAQQFHFLNFDQDKGGKECLGSICCRAFGAPQQRYYVPCWVYSDPQRSYAGSLLALALTPAQYEDFVKLEEQFKATGYSITQFDMMSSTHKQGQGTRTGFQPLTLQQSLLNYATGPAGQEFWQQIQQSMEAFYALAEVSLQQPMTVQKWLEVIQRNNVELPDDVTNGNPAMPQLAAPGQQQAFPGGQFGNGVPASAPNLPAGQALGGTVKQGVPQQGAPAHTIPGQGVQAQPQQGIPAQSAPQFGGGVQPSGSPFGGGVPAQQTAPQNAVPQAPVGAPAGPASVPGIMAGSPFGGQPQAGSPFGGMPGSIPGGGMAPPSAGIGPSNDIPNSEIISSEEMSALLPDEG